ncbi:MAG TPA: menaquinone biosynthesis protein, partial [Chthoniobacterales bacterium]
PSALCRMLARGELDAAFVSSFEFLANPIYEIVDDVAVGSNGAVGSVFVAHNRPLAQIEELVVDPASRTSVNLLQCLLAESDLSPRLVQRGDGGARLLIGDQALRFREQHGDAYAYRDLGAWWNEVTGLPFVFALWLIRPEVANAKQLADQLRARRDANLTALDELIAAETEFSPEFCQRYFREQLRFGFAEREKEGLLKFRSLCERHGILPRNTTPLRLV